MEEREWEKKRRGNTTREKTENIIFSASLGKMLNSRNFKISKANQQNEGPEYDK